MDHLGDKPSATKTHAACDECLPGTRKVKCSGDSAGCTRCHAEGIKCHYSDKKPMGRPRKRPRESYDPKNQFATDLASMGVGESDLHGVGDIAAPTGLAPITASDFAWDLPSILSQDVVTAGEWNPLCSPDLIDLPFPNAANVNTATNGSEDIEDSSISSNLASSSRSAAAISAPCSCLKELYAMLASFQSLPPLSFPSSRGPLLKATSLCRAVVRCPMCPQDYPSALQNLMLLTTLLPLIVHGYAKLLQHIHEQAAQGCAVTFRVGDTSQAASHLHTGTPDCPMGFNIELDADEWSAMARKVVKQDVYGNAQNMDCLLGVVEELEQRQHIWHVLRPFDSHDPNPGCQYQPPEDESGESRLCLRLVDQSRKAIEALEHKERRVFRGADLDDQKPPRLVDSRSPSVSYFTDYAENDKWWSTIFSDPQADQGEDEDTIEYCNRVVARLNNLTNVDKDFLGSLAFHRARNGLLKPIKDVLNAQLDQPCSLNDLAKTASRIQQQLRTRGPGVSIFNRGPVLQITAPPITIPQRGSSSPSAQRSTLSPHTEQDRSVHSIASGEEVRQSPGEARRSEKRKSLHDFDEAELEQALLQKRHAGNAREGQVPFSMQGEARRLKDPQAFRDSLGGGPMGRQRCREKDHVRPDEVRTAIPELTGNSGTHSEYARETGQDHQQSKGSIRGFRSNAGMGTVFHSDNCFLNTLIVNLPATINRIGGLH
ncbi:MAG: hypothetical protein Q9194_006268 [Teloschistes cf. exilis]